MTTPSKTFGRLALGAVAAALAGLAVGPASLAGEADTTRLVVRAVAADAKVIGSGVGGARVTVEDAASGKVLAEGVQRGGTGDTEAIVRRPHARGEAVYGGEGTAAFTADLALDRPTRVRVTVEGPLDAPATSRQRATRTIWMVPGRDVDGEGLVLTLHGFLVEVLDVVSTGSAGDGELEVTARVRMMCGCPTRPGGLWDSDRYAIAARLVRDGEVVAESPMAFSGRESVFRARLPTPGEGSTSVEVVVTDTERANTGYARRALERP